MKLWHRGTQKISIHMRLKWVILTTINQFWRVWGNKYIWMDRALQIHTYIMGDSSGFMAFMGLSKHWSPTSLPASGWELEPWVGAPEAKAAFPTSSVYQPKHPASGNAAMQQRYGFCELWAEASLLPSKDTSLAPFPINVGWDFQISCQGQDSADLAILSRIQLQPSLLMGSEKIIHTGISDHYYKK